MAVILAKLSDAQWGLLATVVVAIAGLAATGVTTWFTLRNQVKLAEDERAEKLRTERRKLLMDLLDKLSEITNRGDTEEKVEGYTWLTSRVRQLAMSVGDPELDEISAVSAGRGDFLPGTELYMRMERRVTTLLRDALAG